MPFITFDRYREKAFAPERPIRESRTAGETPDFDFRRLNWHELLTRLDRAFPTARTRVYFYEQVRGREARLLSEIIGIPVESFALPTELERRGFSARAVQELHQISTERTIERSDVRKANSTFPSGSENPSFSPWTDDERRRLRREYERHSELISADPALEVLDLRDLETRIDRTP
jgi:hypothetical protein